MLFDCPITSTAMPAWHAAIHLGLAAFAVVVGSGFAGRATIVYRRRGSR